MPSGEGAPPPSAATIAWNWVIEELADCKEFDSSIFGALMRWDRNTVADPTGGGRVTERLALKYLEELMDSPGFVPLLPSPESASTTPVPGSEAWDRVINVSASSESILYHLLQEVGGLNTTGNCINESCRNNLRQVILQKRAALHKSSLDVLKDLILKDCCQGPSSSNNLSCLVSEDQTNSLHTDNVLDHEIASKKLKSKNSHIELLKLLSAISSETNHNLLLKEATTVPENQLSNQNVQVGLDDNSVYSRGNDIGPLVQKNKMLQSGSPMKAGTNVQLPDVSSDDGQNVISDSSCDGDGFYDVASEVNPDDEIMAAETLKLLNSQNPVNKDSQISGLMQQRTCIKCDEGGQLLSCTGSGCPIAVHESCLASPVDTDKPGEFKCPFCSYLLAASAYYEARKKVSVAKKNLSSFMGWGGVELKKVQLPALARDLSLAIKPSSRIHVDQRSEIIEEPERENQTKTATDGNEGSLPAWQGHIVIDRNNGAAPPGEMEMLNECHVVSKAQHQVQAVAATVSDGHALHIEPPDKGKRQADNNHCHFTRMARRHLSGECKSAVVNKPCHTDAGTPQIMVTDKGSPFLGTGNSEPSDRHNNLDDAQGLRRQQQVCIGSDTINLPSQENRVECERVRKQESAIEHDLDQQNSSGNHSGEQSSSNNGRKQKNLARHSMRYTNPLFPYARRNRLPWTSEEEAVLKEAMQKFYPSCEKNISWIKIWEFGRHIFHKTRQPVDLKDKWRNIKKRDGENWKRKSGYSNDES